jgi:hypothetical protein
MVGIVVANLVVVVFLGVFVYEYMRSDGLKSTFYTLKDEFQFAKDTIQSVSFAPFGSIVAEIVTEYSVSRPVDEHNSGRPGEAVRHSM